MSIEQATKFRLLEETAEEFSGLDAEGREMSFPRIGYFKLKYLIHKGERIDHKWRENRYILETYNDGIFNCCFDDQRMQISDSMAVAEVILSDNVNAYKTLFVKWYSLKMQREIVNAMLNPFKKRITICDDMFVVDGIFAVNEHAEAQVRVGDKWKGVCIVASHISSGTMSLPGLGTVEINDLTAVIVAKLYFLLNPNVNDQVFTQQLTPEALKHIRGQ